MGLLVDADVFLFDLDGTVYLGDKPIDGAIETLLMLEEAGKKVFFLTNNSSKDKKEYLAKLSGMGYPVRLEQIITSTMAAIEFLTNNRQGKSVYPVGTKAFINELDANGITIKEDADIVLLGFDTTLTYDKIWKANILLEKGREFIVTHPDIVCPSDIGDMPDVGALMALLECSSGRAPSVICGKPYSPMARIISKFVWVDDDRIVMVGDRLYTDILFAVNNNFKSMLVFSGETTPQMLADSGIVPTYTMQNIREMFV